MVVSKRKKQRAKWQRWLRYAGVAMLAFVLGSVLLVLPLRWLEPATTAFMLLDDSGRNPLLHEWVDWPQLGTGIALAAVASEDQRFADHFGLDPTAIRKSLGEQETRGYLRGASTISQQTAKNLFLWRGRSFVRKGLEAWFTLVLEICLPKRRILEIYLNLIEWGDGIFGCEAGARAYFGKSAAELTREEAALMAAAIINPRELNVGRPNRRLLRRQQIVLRRPFGKEPGSDWFMWLIWLLFGIGLPVVLRLLTLIVEVWPDRIVIRYVPLTTREIPLADIRRCEARIYRPVWEYGGWGIKGWSRRRMSYSVRGGQGVQLELRDGRTVMIGSQRAEDLARTITTGLGGPGTDRRSL